MSTCIQLNLKHLRESKGFSKTRMAELVGKSDYVIHSYESGKIIPPVPVLEKYATIFKVPLGQIVDSDLFERGETTQLNEQQPVYSKGRLIQQRSDLKNILNK